MAQEYQTNAQKFYRYDTINYTDGVRLHKAIYYRLKETPCGYWIHHSPHYDPKYSFTTKPKWISKTSKKKFAYPTEEEALRGFIMRKRRQVAILQYKLDDAWEGWDLALQELRKTTREEPPVLMDKESALRNYRDYLRRWRRGIDEYA